MSFGLRCAAFRLPEGYGDAQHISRASGVPEPIVREKLGNVHKCRAEASDQYSAAGLGARLADRYIGKGASTCEV